MDRKELVEKLNAIREEEKQIREQIDIIDYQNKFNDAKQYEGKYFKEVNPYHNNNVRCLFIYGTDKDRCEPMALSISYWIDNETSYFDIQYYPHFHPKKWNDDDDDKWIEISEDEYIQHYNEVQKRIVFAVSAKTNNSQNLEVLKNGGQINKYQ